MIRNEKNGGNTWSLGNTREYKLREDWEEVKVDTMYKGNLEKFTQDNNLKNALISTTGEITAGGFPFWAEYNGYILMRIREVKQYPLYSAHKGIPPAVISPVVLINAFFKLLSCVNFSRFPLYMVSTLTSSQSSLNLYSLVFPKLHVFPPFFSFLIIS
jgi:hypothetical protein